MTVFSVTISDFSHIITAIIFNCRHLRTPKIKRGPGGGKAPSPSQIPTWSGSAGPIKTTLRTSHSSSSRPTSTWPPTHPPPWPPTWSGPLHAYVLHTHSSTWTRWELLWLCRVFQQVVRYLLLTSNQKFSHSRASLYLQETLNSTSAICSL